MLKRSLKMEPEYEELFRTEVRFRIIEKRTKVLEKFAATINTNKLISVAAKAQSKAQRKRCFVNVEEMITRSGGKMITGWLFNEFENRTIEAEAHAIWMDRFGKKRVDITPHDFQPERVIFLPDSEVAKKRGYTAHPRIPLSDDPLLANVEAFDWAIQLMRQEKFDGFGKEMRFTIEEVEEARKDANLPIGVAQHIFEGYQSSDMRDWELYGCQ